MLTSDEVLELIRERIRLAGAAAKVARDLGVTPAFLSDVLNGRRNITARLAAALGLARVVRFSKIGFKEVPDTTPKGTSDADRS
jgi:transcriptional regulator with XRE-family HTH domain